MQRFEEQPAATAAAVASPLLATLAQNCTRRHRTAEAVLMQLLRRGTVCRAPLLAHFCALIDERIEPTQDTTRGLEMRTMMLAVAVFASKAAKRLLMDQCTDPGGMVSPCTVTKPRVVLLEPEAARRHPSWDAVKEWLPLLKSIVQQLQSQAAQSRPLETSLQPTRLRTSLADAALSLLQIVAGCACQSDEIELCVTTIYLLNGTFVGHR